MFNIKAPRGGWNRYTQRVQMTEKVICPRCGGSFRALKMHENKLSCRKRAHVLGLCRQSVQDMVARKHSAFRLRRLVSGSQAPATIAASFFARNTDLSDPLGFVVVPDGDNLGRMAQFCTAPKNLIDLFSFLSALKGDAIRYLDNLTGHAVKNPDSDATRGLLVSCTMHLTMGFGEPELTEDNFVEVASSNAKGLYRLTSRVDPASKDLRANIQRTLCQAQDGLYAR